MAKLGTEVEGRMKGVYSLFVDADEFKSWEVWKRVDEALRTKIKQIYISDHEGTISLTSDALIQYLLLNGYEVTVETKYIPSYGIIPGINIMLVVDCPHVWNLRKNDQIKFSMGQYVYATSLDKMHYTKPEDFAGDVNV